MERNYNMDACRGVAALLVMFCHLRPLVLKPYSGAGGAAWFEKIIDLLSGFGHQSVMIFFVLSGYLISKGVWDRRSRWSWISYLHQRLCRLWVVLVPALILTLIINLIGLRFCQTSYYHGGLSWLYNSGPSGAVDLSWRAFLGNVAFLQTIFVPAYGDNMPLWSLANEFWYYILFPAVVLTFFSSRRGLVRNGMLALVVLVVMPVKMKWLFLVWVMGFFVHLMNGSEGVRKLFARRVVAFAAGALFLVVFQGSHSWGIFGVAMDALIGFSFALFLLSILNQDLVPGFLKPVALLSSEVSYTLYLVHYPFMALIASLFWRNDQWAATFEGYLVFFSMAIATFAYAVGVYYLFEKNTDKVRRSTAAVLKVLKA